MSAFSAEVVSECGACKLPRTFFVQDGVAVCSACGWSPTDVHRATSFAHEAPVPQECPSCGKATFAQLVEGRWACHGCGWEGQARNAKSTGAMVMYSGAYVDAEVAWALQQDKERGQPGGGGNKSAKKKDTKGGKKFVKDIDDADAEQKTIEFVRGARKHVMSLPGVEEDSEFIRAAIAAKILGEI